MDSLAEKIMRRLWFACAGDKDSRYFRSVSTQTCLLMLKLTLLDKFSISIPTPEISLSSPTAAAANPSEWVILPLTDSGQHGSLVSGFLSIGSDSSLNSDSALCAQYRPRENSSRLFEEYNVARNSISSGRSRKSDLGGR